MYTKFILHLIQASKDADFPQLKIKVSGFMPAYKSAEFCTHGQNRNYQYAEF